MKPSSYLDILKRDDQSASSGIRKSRDKRLRQLVGLAVSVCVVAFVAVVVGMAAFGPFKPFDSFVQAGILHVDDEEDIPATPEPVYVDADEGVADYTDIYTPKPIVREESGVEYRSGEVMIGIDKDATYESINEMLARYDFIGTKDATGQDLNNGFVKVIVTQGTNVPEASQILEDDGIPACPNYVLQLSAHPSPNLGTRTSTTELPENYQWMLDSMDTRKAWGIQKASEGKNGTVSIAVIDSGCRVTHVDLSKNIRATYNAVYAYQKATNKDWTDVTDIGGHGTHVAGIAAADATNNVGINGSSHDAGLLIIKVVDDNGDISFDYLAQAYAWLMSDDDGNGRTIAQEHNVRVANVSIGGKGTVNLLTNPVYAKIDETTAAGILTVSAAGNEDKSGEDQSKWKIPPYQNVPGDYEKCFEVINLTADTDAPHNDSGDIYQVYRHSSSNYNIPGTTSTDKYTKDISAPGSIVWSTAYNRDVAYSDKTGTSMASPAVAGVAALVFANKPELTPAQVQTLLENTATDLSGSGVWCQEYGYGEVDAYRALQVTSAEIGNESLEYLMSDDLKLKFGDGTVMTWIEWKESATTDRDTWTWKSSNSNVATIDTETGKLVARSVGKTTLTAEFNGLTNANGSNTIVLTKEIEVTPFDLAHATIGPEDPSNPGYLLAPTSNAWVYSGKEVQPSASYVRVSYEGSTFNPVFDYSTTYANNVNAGEATLTITAKEGRNVTGSKTVKFKIEQQDLNQVDFESIPAQAYTGSPAEPNPVITYNNKQVTLVQGTDYTLSYSNNVEPGNNTASVIVTAMKDASGNYTGNFKGEKTLTFSISSSSIQLATIEGINATYPYTGSKITPKPTVKLGDKTLQEGTDYRLVYKNNLQLGEAVVEVHGEGMYTGVATAIFHVVARNMNSSGITVEKVQAVYTGVNVNPKFNVWCDGKLLQEGVDYSIGYLVACTNVNDAQNPVYRAKIRGMGNFTGWVDGEYTIVPRSISEAVVEFDDQVYTGGALRPTPKVTVLIGTQRVATLTEGVDYTISYQNNTNVGTASVTITGINGYKDSKQSSFTILRSLASASISVPAQQYTGNYIEPNVTIKAGNTTLVKGVDYTLSYENNLRVCSSSAEGAPRVVVTGIGSYGGTREATFSITQAAISGASVTVANQTYTGKALTPAPTVTYMGKTLTRGTDYTVAYSNNVNKGTATLTLTGVGNFTGTKTATFTISEQATQPTNPGNTGNNTGNNNNNNNSGNNNSGNSGNTGNSSNNNSSGSNNNSGNSSNNSNSSNDSTVKRITMYRLYNPNSGEHFYTASVDERSFLVKVGWKYEGVAWTAPDKGDPVYRMYNPNAGDHHYTTSIEERTMLVRAGWKYEGIGWYSSGSVGLHRLYNPNAIAGAHHYTTSVEESNMLIRAGWKYEGVGWHGLS